MSANALQDQLVKELTEREQLLNDKLAQTEKTLMQEPHPVNEAFLDDLVQRLAAELTDIDEVLRLLEAR